MSDAAPGAPGAGKPSTPRQQTVLSPAARVLWRSEESVQLELGTRRLLLEGLSASTVRHLIGRAARPPAGTLEPGFAQVQARLVEAGFLWSERGAEGDPRWAPPLPRLAGELVALSTRHGDQAAEVLSARSHYAVVIHGAGRVGAHVAAVLAAAGVGRVHVLDHTPVRLHQTLPGGVRPADEGVPLSSAATAAVLRAAPNADTTAPPLGDHPDLVVLAVDEPIDVERNEAMHSRGCAHLLVQLAPDHGVVGPLVLPGLTSCLACADLHRRDRDPAWTALAVQLSLPHRSATASEVAVATVMGGLAALEALRFLDGGQPSTIEATLEMHQPDWRVRRRSWPAHPDRRWMMPMTIPAEDHNLR